jgi:transposase
MLSDDHFFALDPSMRPSATAKKSLYILMTSGYTPNGSGEKSFLSDYQKRNLLLSYRAMRQHHTNPNKEVSMVQNEDSRLKEFRQLKEEIRGSAQHLVVGIDIAKERHYAFFGTPAGKTLLRRMIFDNTKEGFEKLLAQAELLKTREGLMKLVFGMEPTSDYHKPLGEYLISRGHSVVLVGGSSVKKNRELLDGRWDRNDTKDAANVADLITQGKCLFYEFASTDLRELRSLISFKRRLKKSEQAYRTRIRNHLIAQYFPEMDGSYGYSEGPALVKWCLDPHEIVGLSFEAFVVRVSSRYVGGEQRKRLMAIHQKAASSIGCATHPSVVYEAHTLLEGLEELQGMLRETDAKIATVCQRFPEYLFILSIPGFGPDISAKVLAALGNPHRFENARQVLKMAGLDLCADTSGRRDEATPVISKRGKADLRYGLYQAAVIAAARNPLFMAYFTKKLSGRQREKGITTKMCIKLAAKMLVIAWTLMKKRQMFDPSYMEG